MMFTVYMCLNVMEAHFEDMYMRIHKLEHKITLLEKYEEWMEDEAATDKKKD